MRGRTIRSLLLKNIPLVAFIATALGITISIILFRKPIGIVWEIAALLATGVLCAHAWADMLYVGEHKIYKVLGIWVNLFLGACFFLVMVALAGSIALASNSLPSEWQSVKAHAALIFLGALFALFFTLTIARANVNRFVFDDREGIPQSLKEIKGASAFTKELEKLVETSDCQLPNKLCESVKSLKRERKLAWELFLLADVPAAIAYLCVCLTVHFAPENTSPAELKMFLAGSVALGLVIVNCVHVVCRSRRKLYD